jgi:peptidoglycan hydrolase-like protein with peptidoglycan-binding domain
MLEIKQQLASGDKSTYAGVNGCKYITIHETANEDVGAGAQRHADLQSNGYTASWHYQVDDIEAIQSFPHAVRCGHAGDGRGPGNYDSIGVEICVNSDGDFKKAVKNTAELVRKIMAEEGIPLSNVVQHNKWSGKNCPTNLRNGSKGVNWSDLIGMIKDAPDIVQGSNPVGKPSTVVKPKPSINKSNLSVDGYLGKLTIMALQRYFGTPIDGVISKPSTVIKALQKLLGVKADGYLGPITIRAMQKRIGTPVDGVISKPSTVIKELQRRLNKGKL